MIDKKISIGKILKTKGLKGELKVDIYSKNFTNIKKINTVYIEDTEYKILARNISNNFLYLFLDQINSIESAEKLKNKELFVFRSSLINLPNNLFYVVDLIGCSAVINNEVIGTIVNVYEENNSNIYEIKGDKKMYVPIIDKLILTRDFEKKIIQFDKDIFYSVMVEN